MKLKKIVILFAFAALTVSAASGCSLFKGKTAESTAASGQAETSSGAAESSAAVTEETLEVKRPESYGTVKLGSYKGVKVSVTDATVTDQEIDDQISSILAGNPEKVEITDRAAQSGDTVNIDYVGKKDGVAFEGGTAAGYDLVLGSNSFIPGFEDGLIGVNKGETKDLTLTFPTEYHSADLAGKEVVFTVTVNGIYTQKAAELTDAWVEKLTGGEQKTVDSYKQFLRESLEKYKRFNSDQQGSLQVLTSVVQTSEFTPNQEAIDAEFNEQKNSQISMANSMGQKYEDYIKANQMTVEDFEKDLRTQAEEIVKRELVIDGIFKAENMKIEDADYTYLAEQYGQDKETLIGMMGQEVFDKQAKIFKVLNFLLANADKTIEQPTSTLQQPAGAETVPAESSADAAAESSEQPAAESSTEAAATEAGAESAAPESSSESAAQ